LGATFDVVIIVPHPPKADMAKAVLSSPPKMRKSGCLSKQREINSIGGPSPFYPWAADWRQG
jgi:hypothetical protein